MPWEKSFEESDVIERVMHVFWQKGYAATSISDITEATGIKRGSLYNAFEGKDDLFLRSLLKYDSEKRQALLQRIAEIENPRDAISTLFSTIIKNSLNDPDKKGCLLVNTSLELPHHNNKDVQKVVTDGFKQLTTFFEQAIQQGKLTGDIPQTVNARSTAKALLACLVGIRVMGRGAFGKATLNQIAEQALRLISQ